MTELVFILDRSGSMAGLEADTIGGFNSLIERERAKSGRTLVSTVLFSGESQVIHDRVALERIRPMTREDYCPYGCTALLDAVGGAIHHIGNIHKYARREDVPERTLFIITTDGMENASSKYNYEKVKAMIQRQREKYGWEFLFLGANMDAAAEAGRFGISEEYPVEYCCDSEGTALNFRVMSREACSMRESGTVNGDWKQEIEQHMKAQRRKR
jgi:uncharacterized protein YegL